MTFFTRIAGASLGAALVGLASFTAVHAAGKGPVIPRQEWSFSGLFGYYDQAQLQRGFKVYQQVCSGCHSMQYLSYRNLTQENGPGFTEDEVKAIIAEAGYEVQDGPNEEGEMFMRPARLSDKFVSPFANVQMARAMNAVAYPPDFSVIANARSAASDTVFAPAAWAYDIATGYQEGGADYIKALLVGYPEELPEGVEEKEGLYYNKYYPGGYIAMAQPLYEESVEYTDGTPTTLDQHAKDVSAFLMWAAEPTLTERKELGLRVMLYLVILAVLLYLAKRQVWSRLKH